MKDYTTICGSAPSEILGIIAVENAEAILARNLSIIEQNLTVLDDFFARNAESLTWTRPKSGTIAFVELLTGTLIDQFCEQLVAQQGVMLVPGSVFDYPGNWFRLGFGRRNMQEALHRLEDFLQG